MEFVKRRWLLTIIIAVICLVLMFGDYMLSELFDWIGRRMDYEASLELGEDFRCVFYRDGTYQVNYHSGRYSFDYVTEEVKTTIFPVIKEYAGSSDKINNLYIHSEEGYVMLTKGNKAIFYIYEDVVLPDTLLKDERVSIIRIKSKREVPFRKVFTTVFRRPKGY